MKRQLENNSDLARGGLSRLTFPDQQSAMLVPEKNEGGLENVVANLWSRKKLINKSLERLTPVAGQKLNENSS